MKVTFVAPLHGGLGYGGAEVQADMTAAKLRELGVEVEFLTPLTRRLGDLVHAFGPYPAFHAVRWHCASAKIPFVLSTISYKHYPSPLHAIRDRLRTRRTRHPLGQRKKLFHSADLLLPNTAAELRYCVDMFQIDPAKARVIPNGVESRFARGNPELFRERFGIHEPFILNVARLEDRKNQVRLIKALAGTGLRLVVIGACIDKAYGEACRRAAGDKVTFLPPIPHEDPLLESAYAAARVFALPSLLETPGISALEAAMSGARIVITPIGGTQEYFGDMAHYADPYSVDSIRTAVLAAWNDDGGRGERLAQRVMAEYSWDAVAAKTLKAYEDTMRQLRTGQ